MAFCHPMALNVTVAESMIRDLVGVSDWCGLWGMKLNAIVSRYEFVLHLNSTVCILFLKIYLIYVYFNIE